MRVAKRPGLTASTIARMPDSRASRALGVAACSAGLGLGAGIGLGGPAVGAAAILGVGFGAVVILNLQAGFAIWMYASLFEAVPALELAAKGATVLVCLAWAGLVGHRSEVLGELLRRHGRLIAAVVLLTAWISVSTTWSERPDFGVILLGWFLAAAIFLVTATVVTRERHLRWIATALIAGAVTTTLAGLGGTPLAPGLPFLEALVEEDRLQGGVGDPNLFSLLLVVAIALAGGLARVARRSTSRAGLLLAIVVLVLGVMATESRGGIVAVLAGIVCALLVFRGHRLALLGVVVALSAIPLIAFTAVPGALERLTTVEEGGTGRTDIWKVAIAVTRDNPIVGVGVGNFPVHSPRYVDELGPLERVDLVAEQLLVVHNAYLELLVETGVVGLALFLTVVVGSLTAGWRAARRLDALGDRSLAILAQSVFVATIAFLSGAVFISSGYDERLWALLGLGPALLAIAARRAGPAVSAPPRAPDEGTTPREPTGAAAGG